MSEWISVEDRLPKHFGRYLTCDKDGNMHVRVHRDDYQYPFHISPYDDEYNMVTHWMPLPEPPKED